MRIPQAKFLGFFVLIMVVGLTVCDFWVFRSKDTTLSKTLVTASRSGLSGNVIEPNSAEPFKAENATDGHSVTFPERTERTLQVGRGDTFLSLIRCLGVSDRQAHRAVQELQKVYDPRHLKIGHTLVVSYRPKDAEQDLQLLSLTMATSASKGIFLKWDKEQSQFSAEKVNYTFNKVVKTVRGMIQGNYYKTLSREGVPASVIRESVRALSYQINWQHDPQPQDLYQIVYEVYQNADGKEVETGNLVYAAYALKDRFLQVYRHVSKNGQVGYYNAEGRSVVKAILQTPLDSRNIRRISDVFGMRFHPLRKYNVLHTGIDYACRPGTAIMAAGAGRVVEAGWKGTYGKYVRIRHDNGYQTAYAHLSRIVVKRGDKVPQGKLIARSGSTGGATGPHLHFEVILNGKHIDPQSVRAMPSKPLPKSEQPLFQNLKADIDTQIEKITPRQHLAMRPVSAEVVRG